RLTKAMSHAGWHAFAAQSVLPDQRTQNGPRKHGTQFQQATFLLSDAINCAILAFFPLFFARPFLAQFSLPPVLRDVGFDQRLNEQVPLDLTFSDDTGQSIILGDYFHDKPVILVLAYYRCPMLCTEVLNGLVRALMDVTFDAGKE